MTVTLHGATRWLLGVITDSAPLEQAHAANRQFVLGAAPDEVVRDDAALRLGIYRHAYWARLLDCLRVDFPATEGRIGGERFEALGRSFLREHPSKGPDLNEISRGFPEYLALSELVAPDVVELAELEWAIAEAIHSPEVPRLDASALSALTPDSLAVARVRMNPYARVFRTNFAVRRFLSAYYSESAPSEIEKRAEWTVVLRHGTRILRLPIADRARKLFSNLWEGVPLLLAFEGLEASPEEVQEWFREWTEVGLLTALTVSD